MTVELGGLTPYVGALQAYDVVGVPGVHIGMPSTRLTMVFPVGEPLEVGWADDVAGRGSFAANVAGLHVGPAHIVHGCRQRGVYVELTVAGARALLGVPAAALARTLAEAADVAPALRTLPEQLDASDAAGWAPTVVGALRRALGGGDRPAARAEVRHALARLAHGEQVADVADEVGYSRRHLGALVRAETGVSPQQWRRLARFERSHALVRRGRASLAEVAAACGFADQSHLTREWVALAGCSPAQWRRREGLPSVQDDTALPGAG